MIFGQKHKLHYNVLDISLLEQQRRTIFLDVVIAFFFMHGINCLSAINQQCQNVFCETHFDIT